ncbi:MAG: cupin domain-containing protein [Desulfuromonadales bacterium]|jgi:mannose-6-phosphate isomerase-like protein (cupin superfamily)
MKHLKIDPQHGFKVLAATERSETATMVLGPGNSTGGPDNTHDRSDQWLFVLSGRGRAVVSGSEVELTPGSLMLIEAGEPHQVDNTGDEPLRTLNFYAPPEY